MTRLVWSSRQLLCSILLVFALLPAVIAVTRQGTPAIRGRAWQRHGSPAAGSMRLSGGSGFGSMERSYEEQTMFERSSSESEHVSSRSFSPEREAQKRSLYLDVDAMLLDRSSDSSVSEWAPDPAEVAKQALKDRAAAAVANRTGLSAAVAGTLLAEREWDLAGVLAEHAPRQGAPAGGAVPRDGAQGWRRYSLRELAAGEEAIDDVASGEEAIDDVAAGEEALGGAGAAAAAAAARRRGVRTLRCEMRPTTAGTAAMGVMFDIEAVGADVMVEPLASLPPPLSY